MVYIDNFYPRYEEYLKELTVRKVHDYIFCKFNDFVNYHIPAFFDKSYLDFGCGTSEFKKYNLNKNIKYVGIDLNKISDNIVGDYTKMSSNEIVEKIGFSPTVFISLFSSELIMPVKEKYEFYSNVFNNFTSIQCGLVSGFYYSNRKNDERVKENENLLSYQTIEHPRDWIQNNFFETTMYFKVPSEMWGQDVVEVWKFFARKSY